jgi:hypothetical protein
VVTRIVDKRAGLRELQNKRAIRAIKKAANATKKLARAIRRNLVKQTSSRFLTCCLYGVAREWPNIFDQRALGPTAGTKAGDLGGYK